MDKLKSLTSNLRSSTSATSNKLSKAFKFDGKRSVLGAGAAGMNTNPFLDGPVLEEPSLPKPHMYLYFTSLFFTFLAICTIGAVAGFQAKWVGVSGGTGFTLFLLLLSFLLTVFLLIVPVVYDRWDRMKRPAQFLAQGRTMVILHAFGSLLMLLSAMIVTISAWTEAGCKDPDNDPNASKGDDFKNGLKQWCNTKKASGIFDWLAFGAWLALLVLSVLAFRRERRREPAFSAPVDTGISYANVHPSDNDRHDPYGDKSEFTSQDIEAAAAHGHERDADAFDMPPPNRASGYGYGGAGGAGGGARGSGYGNANASHMERPSVDAYGAFDGDMPGNREEQQRLQTPSRTMQMAYADPYAQIRQSLMDPRGSGYGYNPQPYAQGGLPDPPAYGGYR
ncbi:hypothetical protein JCM24511_05229 [Saitozyma sp. JCM 24511]|nr:hypothetical protein JCM24511_05229 [Saitozyma sp. JCM 24511]